MNRYDRKDAIDWEWERKKADVVARLQSRGIMGMAAAEHQILAPRPVIQPHPVHVDTAGAGQGEADDDREPEGVYDSYRASLGQPAVDEADAHPFHELDGTVSGAPTEGRIALPETERKVVTNARPRRVRDSEPHISAKPDISAGSGRTTRARSQKTPDPQQTISYQKWLSRMAAYMIAAVAVGYVLVLTISEMMPVLNQLGK
ncbi:hypothetical protein [Thalassospira sp.]|uniref:hypothetical protein n=1 Tax=Thalassospira sp. TaxID=1912094 RepID=UPI0027330BC2|nr:hypothetical protein [Thalassospira sp.]MDP2698262.1 hypothetical protein [Thalassospira sp.]